MAEYPVSSWAFTFTPDKTRPAKTKHKTTLQRLIESSKTRQLFKDKTKTALQRQDNSSKARQLFKDKTSLQRQDKTAEDRTGKDETRLGILIHT